MAWEIEFEEFYKAYPRHVGKGDALKAYQQQMKKGFTPTEVMEGCTRFAQLTAAAATDSQFVPHPATWLRALRFKDEAPPLLDRFKVSTGRGFGGYQKVEQTETRPILWFYLPRGCWKPEWKEEEIPERYRRTFNKLKGSPAHLVSHGNNHADDHSGNEAPARYEQE